MAAASISRGHCTWLALSEGSSRGRGALRTGVNKAERKLCDVLILWFSLPAVKAAWQPAVLSTNQLSTQQCKQTTRHIPQAPSFFGKVPPARAQSVHTPAASAGAVLRLLMLRLLAVVPLLLLRRRPSGCHRWLHGRRRRWRRTRRGGGACATCSCCRGVAVCGCHEARFHRAQHVCSQLLQPCVLLRLALVAARPLHRQHRLRSTRAQIPQLAS